MNTTTPSAPTNRMLTRPVNRPFRTPVRGHAYAARPVDMRMRIGQEAELIREPTNPADELAVGIWVRSDRGRWRIGYLDRAVAARVAPRLDAGIGFAAQIEGWVEEPGGRWQRPLVRIVATAGDESGVRSHATASHAGGSSTAGVTSTAQTGTRNRRSAPGRQPDPRDRLWGRPPGVVRRVIR